MAETCRTCPGLGTDVGSQGPGSRPMALPSASTKNGNAAHAVGRCGYTLHRSSCRKRHAPLTCESTMIRRPSRTCANVSGSPSMSISFGAHHSTICSAASREAPVSLRRSASVSGTRMVRQQCPHRSHSNSGAVRRSLTRMRLRPGVRLLPEAEPTDEWMNRCARAETRVVQKSCRSPSRRGCQQSAHRRQTPLLDPAT